MRCYALALVLAGCLALPANAQDTVALDAPTVTITVPADSVVLTRNAAKLKDAKCSDDAAQAAHFKSAVLAPWWVVTIVAVAAASAAVAVTVGVYEAGKAKP